MLIDYFSKMPQYKLQIKEVHATIIYNIHYTIYIIQYTKLIFLDSYKEEYIGFCNDVHLFF